MKLTPQQIEHLMLRASADALGLGLPRLRFPFRSRDVAEVHTHKDGVGDGVWFRLNDGRVFNCFAEEQLPDQSLYDDGGEHRLRRRAS